MGTLTEDDLRYLIELLGWQAKVEREFYEKYQWPEERVKAERNAELAKKFQEELKQRKEAVG